jgi:5-methylcytosine-specific restriction endonuclease McrA
MPIPKALKHFYGRKWRKETRPAALERAGHECQHCGKADRIFIDTVTRLRIESGQKTYEMYWRPHGGFYLPGSCWIARDGRPLYFAIENSMRFVMVVLTVAHLNNTPGDDRPENLRALCQWCHLIYDLEHHHRTRAARKDAERPLFATLAEENRAVNSPS